MPRLADTLAAELAQQAWFGHDRPGPATEAGIRTALQALPGDTTLEDVREWAYVGVNTIATAPDLDALEARIVGAIASALVLGAMLERTNGT